MSWGFNNNGSVEPTEDFDFDEIDRSGTVDLSISEQAVAKMSALISWAETARDLAAMRYVLKIDQRRPVEIARGLGISRQLFNTSVTEARRILRSI